MTNLIESGAYDALNAKQKSYLAWCLQATNADIHDGVLPFVSVVDAVLCLRARLAQAQEDTSPTRFVRGLLSTLLTFVPGVLCVNSDSSIISLAYSKLVRRFGAVPVARLEFWPLVSKFMGDGVCQRTRGIIQLRFVMADRWQVTAPSEDLDKVTTWLAENCR